MGFAYLCLIGDRSVLIVLALLKLLASLSLCADGVHNYYRENNYCDNYENAEHSLPHILQ